MGYQSPKIVAWITPEDVQARHRWTKPLAKDVLCAKYKGDVAFYAHGGVAKKKLQTGLLLKEVEK